ncbi:sodium channel subunit beta-1-like [Arapaima gigas]
MVCRKILLVCSLLIIFYASHCQGGCAEVDSMTEAVAGESFMLGCISCKRREEVSASATVDWYFRPLGEQDFYQLFHYEFPTSTILHKDYQDRLEWHGTEGTSDVQVGAIFMHNVTFNDTGTYRCTFVRTIYLSLHEEVVTINKNVELTVVAKANRELAAVISEIMMYVLIAVLQLWMIGILVFCYRKISAETEAREARQALQTQDLHVDSKDNCDGVHLD